MRTFGLKACLVVFAGLALGGCPDSMGEFDEFIEKSEPFRVVPQAGVCTGPVDLSGSYLLGAVVVVDKTKTLRFKLDLDVDLAGNSISGDLQGIAVPPNNGATAVGTLVGDVYSATAELDPTDGSFSLDFGEIVVPTEANPILATAVTTTITLTGCTSTTTDACGIIEGQISKPLELPLAGSSWALNPFPDSDVGGVAVETGCPAE